MVFLRRLHPECDMEILTRSEHTQRVVILRLHLQCRLHDYMIYIFERVHVTVGKSVYQL